MFIIVRGEKANQKTQYHFLKNHKQPMLLKCPKSQLRAGKNGNMKVERDNGMGIDNVAHKIKEDRRHTSLC